MKQGGGGSRFLRDPKGGGVKKNPANRNENLQTPPPRLLIKNDTSLTFENQLVECIHYCSEIEVNLLLNTNDFHGKFRFIFSLILSENAPNFILEKLNFKTSRGRLPQDLHSVVVPSALDHILARPTLNCFRRACRPEVCLSSTHAKIEPGPKGHYCVVTISKKRTVSVFFNVIFCCPL